LIFGARQKEPTCNAKKYVPLGKNLRDRPEVKLCEGEAEKKAAEEYLRKNLAPGALENPLGDNPYLISVPHSKELLPQMFEKAEVNLSKKDYYQVAAQMKKEKIHPEVVEKLEEMAKVLVE
jgi:hypothetical protein